MTMSLVDLIVHVYRTEDRIVSFMKLYSTSINGRTVTCIRAQVFYEEEPNRSTYELISFSCLHVVLCKAEGIILIIFNNKR
jgi:hypothetical protein